MKNLISLLIITTILSSCEGGGGGTAGSDSNGGTNNGGSSTETTTETTTDTTTDNQLIDKYSEMGFTLATKTQLRDFLIDNGTNSCLLGSGMVDFTKGGCNGASDYTHKCYEFGKGITGSLWAYHDSKGYLAKGDKGTTLCVSLKDKVDMASNAQNFVNNGDGPTTADYFPEIINETLTFKSYLEMASNWFKSDVHQNGRGILIDNANPSLGNYSVTTTLPKRKEVGGTFNYSGSITITGGGGSVSSTGENVNGAFVYYSGTIILLRECEKDFAEMGLANSTTCNTQAQSWANNGDGTIYNNGYVAE